MADASTPEPSRIPVHAQTDAAPLFARPALAGPFGPQDEPLKTGVDIDTALAFRRLCNDAGTDVAGALRDWVYSRVHGKTYTDLLAQAAERRRAVLFGEGRELVGNGSAQEVRLA